MKCPYRKEIKHQPEIREGERIRFERLTEEFCECYKYECPFYYTIQELENCERAEKEADI